MGEICIAYLSDKPPIFLYPLFLPPQLLFTLQLTESGFCAHHCTLKLALLFNYQIFWMLWISFNFSMTLLPTLVFLELFQP